MRLPMIHGKALGLGILLFCGLVLLAGPAPAAKDTPFSAEHITIPAGGGKEMKSMIYFTKDRMRMEMNQPGGPGKVIVIYLKKSKKMVMLSPKKKAYFEMPLDESQWPGLDEQKDVKKKKLGTETVSGYKCTKYSAVRKMSVMGQTREIKVISWESDRIAFPIRIKTDQGIQELRKIKEGRPPAKVFKIPGGYQKAASMMELMMP